jgi:hypothetical protein
LRTGRARFFQLKRGNSQQNYAFQFEQRWIVWADIRALLDTPDRFAQNFR